MLCLINSPSFMMLSYLVEAVPLLDQVTEAAAEASSSSVNQIICLCCSVSVDVDYMTKMDLTSSSTLPFSICWDITKYVPYKLRPLAVPLFTCLFG